MTRLDLSRPERSSLKSGLQIITRLSTADTLTSEEERSLTNRPVGEDLSLNDKTVAGSVYRGLRHKILSGAVAPGTQLKFAVLRSEFDVSVGTLREVLIRLVSERLVSTTGQQGFKVTLLSQEEMHDVMWLRGELDALAIVDAIKHGDGAWEASIVGAFHRLSKIRHELIGRTGEGIENVEMIHRAFHRALIAACTSNWLLHFHERLDEHSLRYRRVAIKNESVKILRKRFIGEHKEIMEAALARDAERAAMLIRDHVHKTELTVGKVLQKQQISAEVAPKVTGSRTGR